MANFIKWNILSKIIICYLRYNIYLIYLFNYVSIFSLYRFGLFGKSSNIFDKTFFNLIDIFFLIKLYIKFDI